MPQEVQSLPCEAATAVSEATSSDTPACGGRLTLMTPFFPVYSASIPTAAFSSESRALICSSLSSFPHVSSMQEMEKEFL